MIRSQKQIEASRANGAKSHGPVTAQGRLNSSKMDWRRGMLGRAIVLKRESRPRFDELHHSLLAELKPTTPIESLLVEKMVVAQWRQMRFWGNNDNEEKYPSIDPEKAVIAEQRFSRQFERALALLESRREKNKKLTEEPTTPSIQCDSQIQPSPDPAPAQPEPNPQPSQSSEPDTPSVTGV
jgi:hypothetical protein